MVSWFQGRDSSGDATSLEEQLDDNYFELGLINSLDIIELISDMEDHFEISFTERHFQDRRFSSIAGLSDLIAELSESSG